MYSPKITPDLIPRLYQLAKAHNIPMTRLVNMLLEHSLTRAEQDAEQVNDPPTPAYNPNKKGKHA